MAIMTMMTMMAIVAMMKAMVTIVANYFIDDGNGGMMAIGN